MRHGLTRLLCKTLVVAVGLLALTALGQAQGRGAQGGAAAAPIRVHVQAMQVKPGMAGMYRDLLRTEVVPAMKKAGGTWFWSFATGPVGQGGLFIHVRPIVNYAEFDKPNPLATAMGAEAFAKFGAKMNPLLVGARRTVDTLNRNASLVSNATTPPRLIVVQDIHPLPGKQGELLNLMASDYLPAFRKAGVRDLWVYVTSIGPGLMTTVRPIDNYAELDRPGLLQRAGMAQEAIQQLNARRNALATLVETNVLAYQADLSFGMPAPVN